MSLNHQCSVFAGVGFALCYTPAIVMVGCYFRERTALAYGIGLSGSGIGTFVLAPVVQLLIDLYSWRGALLVLSAFVANLCVCGALLRPITVLDFKEEEETGEEKTTGKIRKCTIVGTASFKAIFIDNMEAFILQLWMDVD